MSPVETLWVYLAERPLLWLTATIAAYVVADWIARRFDRHPLLNPVVIAATLIVLVLHLTGTSFATYFEGAQFVHFMLGPATVALAVPLAENRNVVRRSLVPIAIALAAGSAVAIASAVGIGLLFSLPREVLLSLAPKSVTTPIAMGIAERLGGIPSLTAVLVIATGIIGAIAVTPLMNVLKIRDYAARGLAAGVAAHGIGTARAFQVDGKAGTFAGIGMALNGLLTALLAQLLLIALF